MRSFANLVSLFSLAIVAALLTSSATMAEDVWYSGGIDVWSPPFNADHQHTVQQYTPPGPASRPWHICASIPHLKDDYWLAVNFGLVNEAKRLGVALNLYEAGGYENLATQQSQIAECVAKNKADALIIGAISADGLNSVVADYSGKGMPVIDLINGIESDKITARVAAYFTIWRRRENTLRPFNRAPRRLRGFRVPPALLGSRPVTKGFERHWMDLHCLSSMEDLATPALLRKLALSRRCWTAIRISTSSPGPPFQLKLPYRSCRSGIWNNR